MPLGPNSLRFTSGYNQDELNRWWDERGLPGNALTIPTSLLGRTSGAGRDIIYSYAYPTEGGKRDKSTKRAITKEERAFMNDLGKFTDPYRVQSGISKVAGTILDVASLAIPELALVRAGAEAANKGLEEDFDPEAVVDANHDKYGSTGGGSVGTDVMAPLSYSRERLAMPTDFRRYGMGPEHRFYGRPTIGEAAPAVPGVAPVAGPLSPISSPKTSPLASRVQDAVEARNSGAGRMPSASVGRPVKRANGGVIAQFVSGGTGAGGREDNIDAKLSENEYVIDAETVALLGDGSPEKGAQKLDEMRQNIRRHKGGALARGQISPDAKEGALQYLAKGGKVSGLDDLLKRVKSRASRKRMMDISWSEAFDTNTNREAGDWRATDLARERIKKVHSVRGASDHKDLVYAEGGKVGALGRLFRRRDPNARLRGTLETLNEALKPRAETPYRPPTREEMERDVARLRREVGAQGGDTRDLRRTR